MSFTPDFHCYDFEGEMEKAASVFLVSNGINDPKKQRDSGDIKTPHVGVQFVFGGFSSRHVYVDQDTKEKFPNLASGKLYLKVLTNRDNPEPGNEPENHGRIRAQLRWLMQNAQGISDLMEFHVLTELVESGSTPEIVTDRNFDITRLSFDAMVSIRSEKLTAPTT
jgi:hypothetical protein